MKYSFLAALYKVFEITVSDGHEKSRISWPRKKLYGHELDISTRRSIVDDAEGLISYHLTEID